MLATAVSIVPNAKNVSIIKRRIKVLLVIKPNIKSLNRKPILEVKRNHEKALAPAIMNITTPIVEMDLLKTPNSTLKFNFL